MKERYWPTLLVATLTFAMVLGILGLTTNWFEHDSTPALDPNSVSVTLAPPVTTPTMSTSAPVVQAASRGVPRTPEPSLLARIAVCESGNAANPLGDYNAQNARSTASGKYQVLDTTWARYFGYQHAKEAPPWVQEQFALALFVAQGSTPWLASRGCWR